MKEIFDKEIKELIESHCSKRTKILVGIGVLIIGLLWAAVGAFKAADYLDSNHFWVTVVLSGIIIIGIVISLFLDVKYKYYDNKLVMAMKPNEGKTIMPRVYAKKHRWKILSPTEEDKQKINETTQRQGNESWLSNEIRNIQKRHER